MYVLIHSYVACSFAQSRLAPYLSTLKCLYETMNSFVMKSTFLKNKKCTCRSWQHAYYPLVNTSVPYKVIYFLHLILTLFHNNELNFNCNRWTRLDNTSAQIINCMLSVGTRCLTPSK